MTKKFLRAYARKLKIGTNQAEAEILQVMTKVCKSISYTYRFPGYEAEDIEQEAYIEALRVLDGDSYDVSRPLENFLYVHLKRKMSNFRRNNYIPNEKPDNYSPEKFEEIQVRNTIKKNILSPIDLSQVRDEDEAGMMVESQAYNEAALEELKRDIDDNLPASIRADYLQMMSGRSITKKRRQQVQAAVRQVVLEGGYLNGKEEEWLASQDY